MCMCMLYEVKRSTLDTKMISAVSVPSPTCHDLCPIDLTCCEVTIGKSQFRYTFIICKKLQKVLLIDQDMQQLHLLGFDWTNDG